MHKSQPIGIFDSGVGGLTVARAIEQLLPHEQIIYVGDTQHMPYGDKSEEHIKQYCKRIIEFLLEQNVKLIVIACNTASAFAASYLRSIFWEKVEIIGVIRPAIKNILSKGFHKVGIIGTQGTINSNIYASLFKEYKSDVDMFQLATPLLAPMIEAGDMNNEVSKVILNNYLQHESFKDRDCILLACTHYPLIKDEVDHFFQRQKAILDNAEPMAEEVKMFLHSKQLLSEEKKHEHIFYVTEFTQNFEKISSLFYGKKVKIIEINIHHED